MSNKPNYSLRKWIVFVVGGMSIGATGMAVIHLSKKNAQALRQPASISHSWGPVSVGKHLTPIRVVLETPKVPESASSEIILRGAVQAMQEIPESMDYHWILPPEVVVVDGQIDGELPSLAMGRFHILELTVRNFSKEDFQNISLEAKGKTSGMGGSASISSRPEDTMESLGVQMRKEVYRATGK